MKWMTSPTVIAVMAVFTFAFSGCDKKVADDLKQTAEDAQKSMEANAKEVKEAADKQIEKAKDAAKDGQAKLDELAKQAEAASQNAIETTKDAAEKLKEAISLSPTPAP